MNKIALPIALSVVGVGLLAIFGPKSLTVVAQLFSDSNEIDDSRGSQMVLAAIGVAIFALGEGILVVYSDKSGINTALLIGGRIAQILGFGIAMTALLAGMAGLRDMASPNGTAIRQVIAASYRSNATTLAIGLGVVFLGQIVVGFGRYLGSSAVALGSPHRNSNTVTTLNRLSNIALFVMLFAILVLFIFTTIFEFELRGKLRDSKELEPYRIANDLQGMMIYPFLAYFLGIFYCLTDGFRGVVGRLSPSNSETAE